MKQDLSTIEKLKTLMQEGSELITLLDSNGICNYVSPTSTKVLQTPPEEFLATNIFDYIHPEDKEHVYQEFLNVKEKTQVQIPPYRFRNKRGDWLWIESLATNKINDPTLKGIILNSRDITVRVQYLKAMQKQNIKLKEIIWNQSHVVRAPVARLKGLITLLQEEELNPEEKEKVLNYMLLSTDEIDKVIQDTVMHAASILN